MRVILIHLSWLFGHLLGRLAPDIAVEEAERAGASAAERTIAAIRALAEGYDRCIVVPDVGGGWRTTASPEHDERHNPWPAPVWAGYEAVATAFEAQSGRDRFGLVMPLPYGDATPPIPCGEAPIVIAETRPAARDVIATIAKWWAREGINHPGNGDALTIVSGRSSLAQLVDDAAGIDLLRDVAARGERWTWKRETTGTVSDWIAKIATSPALVPEVTALASLKGIGLETARVLVCGGELRRATLPGYGSAVAAVEAAVREEKIPGLIAGQLYTLRAAGARQGAGVLRALAVARLWSNVDLDVGALLGARGEERGHGDDEAVQGRAPSAHEDRAAEVRGAVHGERASAEDRGARGREPAAQGARAGGVVGGAGAPAAPGAPAGVRDAERSAPRGDVDVRADGGPVLRVAPSLAQPRVAASQAEPGSNPGTGAEPAPASPVAPAARAAPSSEARVTGEGAAEGSIVQPPGPYRHEPRPPQPTAAERIHDDGAHVAREETTMSMQPQSEIDQPYEEPRAPLARREPEAPMMRSEEAPRGQMTRLVPPQPPAVRSMTSEATDVIFRELALAQLEFGEVKKSRTAEVKNRAGAFLYSYQYANLSDVTNAVMPALKKHGIVPMQIPRVDKIVVRLIHGASNQWIEGALPFVAPGHGPDGIQALGSAITYMRRYLLAMMLGIVAVEDDDDGAEAESRGRAA